MTHYRTTANLSALALCGLFAPCLAFAVNAPSGESLEHIDTTFLGAGQEVALAAAPRWAIQVGAFANEALAEAQLTRIAERAPDGMSLAIRRVTSFAWDNGRMFYRARFGGLDSPGAQAACAFLNRHGENCFVVAEEPLKPGNGDVIERVAPPVAVPLSDDNDAPALQVPASVQVLERLPVLETEKVTANSGPTSILSSAAKVNNTELSDMRGGFFTAAGAQFDFGASIRTLVNGQLALQTNVQWTPAGQLTQQLSGLGASIDAQVASNLAKAGIGASVATPAINAADAMAGAGPTGHATPTVTSLTPNVVTPDVSDVPGPASPTMAAPAVVAQASPITAGGLSGVQISNATGGSTQVFANVGAGQIQSIILNSASNQTISQNTNITLTIYNFPAWQQQLLQNAVSSQLAHDILAASGLSGH